MKKTKMKRPSTDILPPEIPNPFPNQFSTNNYILIHVLLQQDLLLGCTKQKSGLAKERVRFGIPLKFRNHNFLYNSSWTSPFKKYELYLTSRGQIVTWSNNHVTCHEVILEKKSIRDEKVVSYPELELVRIK